MKTKKFLGRRGVKGSSIVNVAIAKANGVANNYDVAS
jgi:hypothetical protein